MLLATQDDHYLGNLNANPANLLGSVLRVTGDD